MACPLPGEVAKEVDTLAGYVVTRTGRVPVRGELVPGPGPFELEILDADPRRLKRMRIYRNLDKTNGSKQAPARRADIAAPSASVTISAPDSVANRTEAARLPPGAAAEKSARRP